MFLIYFLVYAVVIVTLLIKGMNWGEWLASSRDNCLRFRSPWPLRACNGIFSLSLFAVVFIFLRDTITRSGMWNAGIYTWGFVLPFVTPVAFLFFYGAGPLEVSIDLDRRMCHSIKGWPIFPKHIACALTEASRIYVYQYNGANVSAPFVALWIGGANESTFTLGKGGRLGHMTNYARRIAEQLGVPVCEENPNKLGIKK